MRYKHRHSSTDLKVSTNEARYMFDVENIVGYKDRNTMHMTIYGSGPMVVELVLTDADRKAMIKALQDTEAGLVDEE